MFKKKLSGLGEERRTSKIKKRQFICDAPRTTCEK